VSHRLALITSAAVIGCGAACSAHPQPYSPPPGALSAGTAHIAISGRGLETHSVRCLLTAPLITIATGDPTSGTTTVVSQRDALTAESVEIRNLDGFTGSYHVDLSGRAEVNITRSTYSITGTAEGVSADNPSFTASRTFSITVAC
jgi:ipoprotein LpqH